MSITSDFSKFKKIDAHSHIGTFGSPFNIHFNADLLLKQMEEFNIEKTILCSDGPHTNEETVAAFQAHPDKIIPLMWINCAEGKPAYDALEHYIRDEHFAGAKLQSLFDGYCADDPCVDPVAEICEKYGKPLFIHSGHPPFSLPWQIGLLAERHPHLPIVMIHMGHGNGMYVQAAIDMAKKYSNLYLETSGMPMHTKIKEAYEQVGSDRIMWGLDAPFHHPTVEMQKAIVSGLSDKQLEDVFYNNIKKLLKL